MDCLKEFFYQVVRFIPLRIFWYAYRKIIKKKLIWSIFAKKQFLRNGRGGGIKKLRTDVFFLNFQLNYLNIHWYISVLIMHNLSIHYTLTADPNPFRTEAHIVFERMYLDARFRSEETFRRYIIKTLGKNRGKIWLIIIKRHKKVNHILMHEI